MCAEKDNPKLKILVCYYQPWQLSTEDLYFPIQAGKSVSGFNLAEMQGDDTGDNISERNAIFGEFTAWYWGWKNIKSIYPNLEYIGLSHYRRFFALDKPFIGESWVGIDFIPTMENYESLIVQKLKDNDVIMTKPIMFGVDLKTQWGHKHNSNDYLLLKAVMHEMYPAYDGSLVNFFERNNTISLYCCFISKYNFFDKYFEWLFPLLFEIEKRIDVSSYDPYNKRVIAFLAERLLNVYVRHNKLRVCYEPIYFINGKRNINPKVNFLSILKKSLKFIMPHGIVEMMQKGKWYAKGK